MLNNIMPKIIANNEYHELNVDSNHDNKFKQHIRSYKEYNVYIESNIGFNETTNNLISCLRDIKSSVKKKDVVNLHVFSYGGSTDTMVDILYYLNSLPCKINVIITGAAMSAGIDIPIAILPKVNQFTIMAESIIMVHSASSVTFGKPKEIKEYSKFFTEYNKRLMNIFKDILPKKLFDKAIKEEKELYISGEEFAYYLKKFKAKNSHKYKFKVKVINLLNI